MTDVLPPGKLPSELLARLIARNPIDDPRVLIGPGVGRDAAAIQVSDRAIVVKTDPITFATADIGRYLVSVNANDIACTGAEPRWLLVTALLPEAATTSELVESIFASLVTACRELDIALVGGHTEITIGLDRPILVGQLIGESAPDRLLDLRRSRPADAVILCSGIAVEGTAILAREAAGALDVLPATIVDRAVRFLADPGISVVPAARALVSSGAAIRGMHDPTEGGLATALHELSSASGLGVEVDLMSVHVFPETAAICATLGLDPLGLIASGALLAVVAAPDVDTAIAAVEREGVRAARIGSMLDPDGGAWFAGTPRRPLPEFPVDEIARYFSSQPVRSEA